MATCCPSISGTSMHPWCMHHAFFPARAVRLANMSSSTTVSLRRDHLRGTSGRRRAALTSATSLTAFDIASRLARRTRLTQGLQILDFAARRQFQMSEAAHGPTALRSKE
eukprot:6212014-Pleurochrysis_carterae.AAC.2